MLLAIEATYLNNDGYVESQKVPQMLDEVEQTVQKGVSEGVIEHYNREDDNIFIKFSSGIPYLFVPCEEGVLAGGGGGRILTLEPNENDYSVNFSYVVANLTAWVGKIEHEDSLWPYSNANLIVETFPDLYTYDYRLKVPYDVSDPLRGNGDSLRNGNVTIESMKTLSDYKVVMFEGHGGYNDEIHSALITGESFVGWKEFSKYKEDLKNNAIVLTSFPTVAETEIPYSPVRYYGITSKFVEKYVGDMDDTVVFLGACSSLKDNVLAQSFLDKGASVVLGYTEITTMFYEMISRTVFFNELVKETSYGYQTVADAYQKTMGIVGVDENECILTYVSRDETGNRYTLNGLLEEPPEDEMQSVDLVTEAYSNDYSYTTQLYNQDGTAEETEVTCIFRIPKINLSGTRIEQINTEIYNTYHPIIEASVEEIKQEGDPFTSEEVSYRWAVNGNLLSLVIRNSRAPDYGGGDEYLVYNFDISSGEEVFAANVMQTAGLSAEAYREKAKQVLGSAFWSNWDTKNENFKNQGFVDFFNEQFRKTISEGNLAESQPYINEKGEICLIAKVHSMAGGDYYWQDLNMIDFELSPNYATEAQCLTSQSQSSDPDKTKPSANAVGSPEWAVEIYMDNKDVWMHKPEFMAMAGRAYGLLDLDFDGVLELIDSENDGSGRYSNNRFYKINVEKQTVEEFFSETDQDEGGVDYHTMSDSIKLLKTPSGSMFYLCGDFLRVGSEEGALSYWECYMKDGKFYENFLFSEYWYPAYENGTTDEIREYDFKGEENTQSEYEKNTEDFYRENKDCNLVWKMVRIDEFLDSDAATQKKLLLEAYRSFSYDGFSFENVVVNASSSESTEKPPQSDGTQGGTSNQQAQADTSNYEDQSVEQLRKNIVGNWGGSAYYAFEADGTCYFLGNRDMPGSYKITEKKVLTIDFPWTHNEYTWSELSFDEFHQKYGYSQYFWYLTTDGVLCLNGTDYHRE